MDKPFVFGTPVGSDYFIGREDEIERLRMNFNSGVNTILMSPRRWGKTSLVKKVAEENTNPNLLIVRMDIFACRSEYDFYNNFSNAILVQTASKFEEWKEIAKGFIERLTPKLSLTPDLTTEYSVSLGITPQTHTPEEILELPQTIARRKKCDLVICIDEFQQIGELPDSLTVQKRMRSIWQHQENVHYCLYGSKMHMMMNLFQKKSYPFYKFGDILNLKPIPLDIWVPYIQERFKRYGKKIGRKEIEKLCNITEYQASYVQQLAYSTLLATVDETDDTAVEVAIQDVLSQNSIAFIEQTQSLTTYQLNFLRAVLDGVGSGFGEARIREKYRLGSPSNIKRLRDALIDKEIIEVTENGLIIGDPILRLWLKKLLR